MVTFSVNIDFLLAWYKIVLSTLALFALQKNKHNSEHITDF